MKKIVWIIAGLILLISTLLLMNHNKTQKEAAEITATSGFATPYEPYQPRREEIPIAGSQSAPILQNVAKVSDTVLTLIHSDSDYQTRLKAMRELGYEIPAQDVDVLLNFLVADIPADAKLRPMAFNSIRNDLYEILLRQKEMPYGLGDLLVNVVNNPKQDSMWRNYCIQFMQPFYEKAKDMEHGGENAGGATAPSATEELQLVRESLWNALEERENSNAGTALLGLDKLSHNHPEFDRKEIDTAMLNLASDDQASVANRITAIRMCGDQGNSHALETARDLAENGDTTMLRCAAIATLGDLGTEDDLVLLETYAFSTEERLQRIAQQALEKLVQK